MMKDLLKTTLLASALVSAMLIGDTAYADSSAMQPQAKTQAKSPARLLFVMSAKSGNITKSGQGYTLTLNNVDPHVLWFTDRPNRRAGFFPLATFLSDWSKDFKGNPPNAALVHAGMETKVIGKNRPMVMELSNPSYSNGKLTFQATNLKGDEVMVGAGKDIKLFFDNVLPGLPASYWHKIDQPIYPT